MKQLLLLFLVSLSANIFAQNDTTNIKVVPYQPVKKDIKSEEIRDELFDIAVDGKVYNALITETGDTLILAKIDDVSISSPRHFADEKERKKYNKMRRYAIKVYPYAQEIIRMYREVEYASENMSKKDRKKAIKKLEKELMPKFEESMRKLTKLQGKIMLKMVEKETGKSTYNIIREVKGKWRAYYWYQASKLYSYNLKEGYKEGKYKILDIVLKDFDLSYRIDNNTDMKYFDIKKVRK